MEKRKQIAMVAVWAAAIGAATVATLGILDVRFGPWVLLLLVLPVAAVLLLGRARPGTSERRLGARGVLTNLAVVGLFAAVMVAVAWIVGGRL